MPQTPCTHNGLCPLPPAHPHAVHAVDILGMGRMMRETRYNVTQAISMYERLLQHQAAQARTSRIKAQSAASEPPAGTQGGWGGGTRSCPCPDQLDSACAAHADAWMQHRCMRTP